MQTHYEPKLIQIKLHITDTDKLAEWLTHLDNLPHEIKQESLLVFVQLGSAVLLEFDSLYYGDIYYSRDISFMKNDPIVAVGMNAIPQDITQGDLEQLEMKRYVL